MKFVILLIVMAVAAPAHAQSALPRKPGSALIISDRAIAGGLDKHQPSAPQSRDSVKNGAIIGALIGGVALGASGAWICTMLREPSDPPCWKSVLPVTAIAAGIGAGVGAGIDALSDRAARLTSPNGPPQPVRRERDRDQ